ncbi:MAG: hypothetical protein J0H04_01055, partial [Hyphomicrobium denitrificans]|nr:hypothetical protein [Hyphomicrobium denitrificans]
MDKRDKLRVEIAQRIMSRLRLTQVPMRYRNRMFAGQAGSVRNGAGLKFSGDALSRAALARGA